MCGENKIFKLAMVRMTGFSLKKSEEGKNNSVFGLIKTLLESVKDDDLLSCGKPLTAVLRLEAKDDRSRFQGVKLLLLQDTITRLFGGPKELLRDKAFANFDRGMLLEYVEMCRRIFVTGSMPEAKAVIVQKEEVKLETALGRAWREAEEKKNKRGS